MIERRISLDQFPLHSQLEIGLIPYDTVNDTDQEGSLLAGMLIEPRRGWLKVEDAANKTAWMLGKTIGLGYGTQVLEPSLAPQNANSQRTRAGAVAPGFQLLYYLPIPEEHRSGEMTHRCNYADLPLAFSRFVVGETVVFDIFDFDLDALGEVG